MATTKTTNCAGTPPSQEPETRRLSQGMAMRIARLARPMKAIAGLRSRIVSGISRSISRGSDAAFPPSMTGTCLRMMITPMAASMPWTTAVGKNSPSKPVRRSPKAT